MDENRYLGDGAYANWNGMRISLAANHHANTVIYLEPEVMDNLITFYEQMKKQKNVKT
jgi:hypothetical protein